MDKPLISIVIINKNDKGILNTLNRLQEIERPALTETIVVDASGKKLDYIRQKFNDIKWINFKVKTDKKYTIPEQRNIGVECASGEIIVFTDANCIPNENWLNNLVQPIIEGTESIVAGATFSQNQTTLHDNRAEIDNEYLNECPTINLAFKKKIYEEVGGFDEEFDYGSDVDFSWRLKNYGYKIKFQKNATITHDWGNGKQEIKREFLYGKARAKLYIKHKVDFIKMLKNDPVIFVYPAFILGLPLTFFFPFYPALILLLALKNIQHKPLLILLHHIVYGLGAMSEVCKSLFVSQFTEARRIRLWLAYFLIVISNILPNFISLPTIFKPILFILLISLTGYIFSFLIKFPREILWQLRIAFSVFYLIILGLSVNTAFTILSIDHPLILSYFSLINLVTSTILFIFALKTKIVYIPNKINIWKSDIVLCVGYFVFIALCIFNSILLNNDVNNILSAIIFPYIALLISFSIYKKETDDWAHKFSLYCFALGLLYLFSLRGNLVNGWDIQSEMFVFNLTNNGELWNINLLRDAYNASLSLNILPTILSNYLHVSGDYIFKVYYPLITAFSLPVIYSFAKKFLSQSYAYILCVFFISQAQFMQQLPALARQQIAFLFFFILIYLCFSKISSSSKFTLQLIIGTGMILSHYSTAYVALAILISGLAIFKLLKLFGLIKSHTELISIRCIIILVLVSLFWYGQLTNTSNSLKTTFVKTLNSLSGSPENSRSKSAQAALPGYIEPNSEELMQEYIKNNIYNSEYLSQSQKKSVANEVKLSDDISSSENNNILETSISIFTDTIKQLFKLGVIIGTVFLIIFYKNKRKSAAVLNIICISSASILLLSAIILLPQLSLNYNSERLYQQIIPIIGIGLFTLLLTAANRYSYVFVTFLVYLSLLAYLFTYVGFLANIVNGNSTLQLSGSGQAYDQYFVHKGEIKASEFIKMEGLETKLIVSDVYGLVKLNRILGKDVTTSQNIYAQTYNSDTVFFLTDTNIRGTMYGAESNNTISLIYPLKSLDTKRNLIYSSSTSRIYK
ncbi:MAG TPA: glycosyltransferase [Candidatus Saccharimonadales bacterium]|jgi:uncharacterized membrane protein/GT2 family glycosyltransferase